MEEKLVLYIRIQELHKRKFKVAKIAKELKISRPIVYKYLEMTFDEAKAQTEQPLGKKKKHWLVERYPDLVVGGSTVRTYMREI